MLKSYSKTSVALLGGLMALGLGFSGGVTKAMAAEAGTVLSSVVTSDMIGSSTTYRAYTTTDFVLTRGGYGGSNGGAAGTNSNGRSNCNLSDANYQKYVGDSGVATSDVAFAVATLTPIAGVGSITYTFTGGTNANRGDIYVLSSSNNLTYSMIAPLKTDEGFSAQGVRSPASGTLTFGFDTIAAETYYAVVVKDSGTSGNFRVNQLVVSFIAGGTAEPSEVAAQFMKRLTDLKGNVVPESEAEINDIEQDYLELSEEVKKYIDDAAYQQALTELKQELATVNQAAADQVIALIADLPEASAIDIANYTNYQDAINSAKDAYDALTVTCQGLVTNYDKLEALLRRLSSVNPEYTLITDSTFLNGATLPTGWTGVGASVFATTRMALRTAGNYLSYVLGVDATVKVKVQVYSATNNATAINTITVYGLDSAGEVVSSQTFEPLSQSVSNATAIDNACSEANSRTVTLDGNISAVKVELTTRNANWVVREIKISYLNTATTALDSLIELMNKLSTCDDYARAPEVRAVYQNSLTASEQAIFDETICQEDPNCTMGTKLAYMEYLLTLDNQNNSQAAPNLISQFGGKTGLAIILVVGILGMGTVAGFYYLNRKRSMN